jgi:hypothetical protein
MSSEGGEDKVYEGKVIHEICEIFDHVPKILLMQSKEHSPEYNMQQ